ncbi:MAG: DnaJ domain-containing protein [Deltaproteobacteria bacterium]|nr:DnaJ domain-containing protein [Deltaproteobacteria bacterium]
MEDYYKTLGVEKGSSTDEIKKAYRKLALKYHPDRHAGNKEFEEKFKKISEAYAVLSDPQKKKQYDTFGSADFHQRYSTDDIFRGTDFGSVFEEMGLGGFESILGRMFGGFGGGRAGGFHPPVRGQDLEYELQVSFDEAYKGAERQLDLDLGRGERRSLKLKIPAGVKAGGRLRVAGKGGKSPTGGHGGDLYVKIDVAPHPDFTRNGNDIESSMGLKISEALLGTTREIATPEGVRKLKVPAGVKGGTKIRLRGLGFPIVGKNERGDFYAVVELIIPKHLSSKQKKIAEQLQAEGL